MTPESITHIVRQMLYTALELSAPFLLLSLAIGLIISIIQACTQMQDMTLSFVPKMLVIALVLIISAPWMLKILIKYTNNLLVFQWDKIISLIEYVQ